jgi:hypothetical protein
MSRNNLIHVYEDTKTKCLSGYYGYLKQSKSHLFTGNDPRLLNIKLEKRFDKTKIEVLNADVLVVTQSLTDGVNKVLTLNLASDHNPGGGVARGAMAQEEELFRRSNYFMFLPKSLYPLEKTNIIYTPNVLIVKDENYRNLKKPFYTSMIAAAAIRHPKLNPCGLYDRSLDRSIMLDTLVLGALGCGAFGNPAIEVIELFNECLKKYNCCFKNITFAVYSRKDDNFNQFNKYIIK